MSFIDGLVFGLGLIFAALLFVGGCSLLGAVFFTLHDAGRTPIRRYDDRDE